MTTTAALAQASRDLIAAHHDLYRCHDCATLGDCAHGDAPHIDRDDAASHLAALVAVLPYLPEPVLGKAAHVLFDNPCGGGCDLCDPIFEETR
jgi:hypothetical protein